MTDDLDPAVRLSALKDEASWARLMGHDRQLLASLSKYARLQSELGNHFVAALTRGEEVAHLRKLVADDEEKWLGYLAVAVCRLAISIKRQGSLAESLALAEEAVQLGRSAYERNWLEREWLEFVLGNLISTCDNSLQRTLLQFDLVELHRLDVSEKRSAETRFALAKELIALSRSDFGDFNRVAILREGLDLLESMERDRVQFSVRELIVETKLEIRSHSDDGFYLNAKEPNELLVEMRSLLDRRRVAAELNALDDATYIEKLIRFAETLCNEGGFFEQAVKTVEEAVERARRIRTTNPRLDMALLAGALRGLAVCLPYVGDSQRATMCEAEAALIESQMNHEF